jgi:hypothetical protein
MSSPLSLRRYPTSPPPLVGELIKLRFPAILHGPNSHLSSSALTTLSSGRQPQHSALVLSVRPNIAQRSITIVAYPVPSYSNASTETSYDSAEAWLAEQPEWKRRRHVAVPPVVGGEGPVLRPTCNGEGWEDRRPCWVLLQEITVELPFERAWKAYTHTVCFSQEEVFTLQAWAQMLPPLPPANANHASQATEVAANVCFAHEPSKEVYGLFRGLGQEWEEEEDWTGEEEEGDGVGPIGWARVFAQWIPWAKEEVVELERRQTEERNKRTRSWVERVMFGGGSESGEEG